MDFRISFLCRFVYMQIIFEGEIEDAAIRVPAILNGLFLYFFTFCCYNFTHILIVVREFNRN